MDWRRLSALLKQREAIAVLFVLTGLVVRLAFFGPLGSRLPYLTLFPAVVFAALLGGLRSGLAATALSALVVSWLYLPPGGNPLIISRAEDRIGMAGFVINGAVVAIACGLVQRRQERLRRAEEAALALQQQRTANALQHSQERLSGVIDSAMDAIITVDAQQRVVLFNPAAERVFGYTAAEMMGQPLDRLIPQRHRAAHAQHVRAFGHTGSTSRRMGDLSPLSGLRRDGSEFPIEATISRLDVEGEQFFTVILRDTTERRRAEERLQQSESFYRQTLESIPGMVFTTRPDGFSEYQSQQWVEYTGAALSEHLGDGWNRFLHPDDAPRALAAWRAAIEDNAPYDLEYRVRRHDGRYEWFRVIARPIRDADGRVVRWFGTAVNIQRLKEAEDEMRAARISAEQAKAAAEQASAAKDHFLAVLSHELRTPLTAVIPALDKIGESLRGQETELLEMTRRNVELEARLIDDLLDVTRIARGKVELDRRPLDLCTVVRRAAEVCAPDIESRALQFILSIEGQCSYVVDGDPARLQQVFWNLIKNAIKFTPREGRVEVRVAPRNGSQRMEGPQRGLAGPQAAADPETVVVEVTDTGHGIDPAHLPLLFGAFEQVERSITRQFGGLGLGLAISRALVTMHGGTIRGYSEGLGRGATFTVELPLLSTVAMPQPGVPAAPAPAAPHPSQPPLRILLVEDHTDTARVLGLLLRGEGHTIAHASDVASALQLAQSEDFDLILSDLGLPDGSGHDLMRELRTRGIRVRGIALSGYGMPADISQSLDVGFAEHITKPVDLPRLLTAIGRVSNMI